MRSRRRALAELAEMDAMELALRVSLLMLLLNPGVLWIERVPVLLLAGAGLLSSSWAHNRALWLALCVATGLPLLWHWPRSDNHEYLLFYWCLAIGCALSTQDAHRSLARSARLLIGLSFAFAVAWKALLSPDYLDGTFFRVALLIDGRFADLAVLLGGLSPELYAQNERFLDQLGSGSGAPPGLELVEPARLLGLARFLTAWTLLTEGAIAVAFLWPPGGLPSRWRHAALLLFSATTYAVATVAGFGWVLLAMGVAQCEPDRRRTRLLYLGAFFLVLAYQMVPWSGLLVDWSR